MHILILIVQTGKVFSHYTLAQVIKSDYKINRWRYRVTFIVSEYGDTRKS